MSVKKQIKKLKKEMKKMKKEAKQIAYSSCRGNMDISVIYHKKLIKKFKKKIKKLEDKMDNQKTEVVYAPPTYSSCGTGYSSCG